MFQPQMFDKSSYAKGVTVVATPKISHLEAAVGALLYCVTSGRTMPNSLVEYLKTANIDSLPKLHQGIVYAFREATYSMDALEVILSAMLEQKINDDRKNNENKDIYDEAGV